MRILIAKARKRRTVKVGAVLAATGLLGAVTAATSAYGSAQAFADVPSIAVSVPEKSYDPMTRAEWTIQPGPVSPLLNAESPTMDVIPVVADHIYKIGARRGFVGQRTDYSKRAITVLWTDEPPADILAYAASRPLGVTVTIAGGAKYSRFELEAARARLLNSDQTAALNIAWTDLNDDGSGFTVGVTQNDAVTADKMASLRAAAGIEDVEVKYGVNPISLYTRPNDSPPWWGGGRTQHDNLYLCTSGFAVLVGNAGRLLGAGHCDPSGNGLVEDGAGQNIAPGGTSVARLPSIDSLLINPSDSPATAPRIFRGWWGSYTSSIVKNWYSNWPGDPVCTSGASTGEHCGTVYDDSDTVNVLGWQVGVIQVSRNSAPMGGQGDSGAPMFKKVSGGVQARGILVGPDVEEGPETQDCGNTNPEGIHCSRWINYVPISTILNTWGVTLETG